MFGDAMEFTLPANAEGPCIEAELNGTDIVFPLGPAMRLSWAECVVDVSPDHTKLFQCELKPGYAFRDEIAAIAFIDLLSTFVPDQPRPHGDFRIGVSRGRLR